MNAWSPATFLAALFIMLGSLMNQQDPVFGEPSQPCLPFGDTFHLEVIPYSHQPVQGLPVDLSDFPEVEIMIRVLENGKPYSGSINSEQFVLAEDSLIVMPHIIEEEVSDAVYPISYRSRQFLGRELHTIDVCLQIGNKPVAKASTEYRILPQNLNRQPATLRPLIVWGRTVLFIFLVLMLFRAMWTNVRKRE